MDINKKEIITVAGVEGSGKSSTAKEIAQQLGYRHFSTGDFMRSMAEERGMRFDEFHELAEKNPEIDKLIDAQSERIEKEENKVVIDSRLAFHFIPSSFKVFLTLNPRTAAERIFKDMQVNKKRAVERVSSVEEVEKSIAERAESNAKRYKELYNIDYRDMNQFNLVVDTGVNSLPQVTEIIIAEYKKWLEE